MFNKITNAYEDSKNRLVHFIRDKLYVNLIVKVISIEFQQCLDAMYKLNEDRWLDKASGKLLDDIGEIVGEPRRFDFYGDNYFELDSKGFNDGQLFFSDDTRSVNGVSLEDEFYRMNIRARILINHRSGTKKDIEDLVYTLTKCSDIKVQDVYPASVEVNINTDIDDIKQSIIVKKIKEALPIGVSLKSLNVGATFFGTFYFNDLTDGVGFDDGILW